MEWSSCLVTISSSLVCKLSPGSEEEEHEGPVCEKLGRIQFSVGYNFQDSTLTVKVLKGQDLPAKDFSGTSDPFVKLYLLPDKKHKLETKVKRKNLNPHWNETFLFEGQHVLISQLHYYVITVSSTYVVQRTFLSGSQVSDSLNQICINDLTPFHWLLFKSLNIFK